jgi:hypothetical protein
MTLTSKITEIGEECLSISRKRQQIEVRIKDLKIVPAIATNEAPLHSKRSKDQAFPGFNSEEEEAKLQFECLLRTQSIAEKSLAELQTQREALKNILAESASDIAFLSEREQLLTSLKLKKIECEDILSNKSNINGLIEEWADKEGYTKDSEPISILSLKGLTQVLIQKGLFIPCHQLQRQWAAMKELKEQREFLTSSSHSVHLPLDEEWLQSVFADLPEVEQNEG